MAMTAPVHAADTIKIGVPGAHSGDLSSYGLPSLNAARIVVDEYNAKGGILGNVLAGNTNMAVSMARTLLNTMSQEKKDELVVQLVTKNRDKLLQKGRKVAADKGIRVQLCDLTARRF